MKPAAIELKHLLISALILLRGANVLLKVQSSLSVLIKFGCIVTACLFKLWLCTRMVLHTMFSQPACKVVPSKYGAVCHFFLKVFHVHNVVCLIYRGLYNIMQLYVRREPNGDWERVEIPHKYLKAAVFL